MTNSKGCGCPSSRQVVRSDRQPTEHTRRLWIVAEPLADAALTQFLTELNAQPLPSAAETGPVALRAGAEERAASRPMGPEMHAVRDVIVPPDDIPARLYQPAAGPTALVVYLHGGGWVIGNIETHDRACRRLAAASGLSILSLNIDGPELVRSVLA